MTKTAAKSSAIPILAIGLEEPAQSFVRTCLPEARMQRISTVEEFTASYERWGDGMFAAILCGPKVASIHNTEIAQVLLTQCPATPKYYITYDTTSFNARELIKNGFQSVFLLPMDQMLLKTALIDIILAAAKSRTFRPVRLFDLEPGSVLEFDTYIFLPLNNKYVKFSAANEPLDPSRFAKLTEHELRSIFVDRSDMRKFYAYASQNSRGEGGEGVLSHTERLDKLRESVRGIYHEIFDVTVKPDFEHGREIIDRAMEAIAEYILKGATREWHMRVWSAIGETGDAYTHAANVAMFAAMFGVGLRHPAPENLALAGLFHDLALVMHPRIVETPEDELSAAERAIYYAHPEKSVNMLKAKRVALPEAVERALVQHHEKFSGRGFPKHLSAERISEDAQILSFAEQFDHLTHVVQGQARCSPEQAWNEIHRSASINPALLVRLKPLLAKINTSASASSPP